MRIRYSDGTLSVDRSGTSFMVVPMADAAAAVQLREGVLDLDVWVDAMSVEIFADGGAVTLSEQIFTADDNVGVFLTATEPGAVIEHLSVTELGDALRELA